MQHNELSQTTHLFQEALVMRRVSRIISRGESFDSVLQSVKLALKEHAGAEIVSLDPWSAGRNTSGPCEQRQTALPESEHERLSHQHVTMLRDGGRAVGRLVVEFSGEAEEAQRRLATFIGEQLGMVLVRYRLQEKNAAARRSLEALTQDLHARRYIPRAVALLAKSSRMRRRDAELWLKSQSRITGLAVAKVAERVVATHAQAPALAGPSRGGARLASHRVA